MNSRGILGCAAVCLLAGCASQADDVAGNNGGGIEIPNGLTVAVKDSLGKPVAHAQVRRLAASHWSELVQAGKGVLFETALTDSNGLASLSWELGTDAWIEALDSAGRGVRASVSDSGTLSLQVAKLRSLAGTWPDSLPKPSRLQLAGTTRSVAPDVAGAFVFDSLPQGTYDLIAEVNAFLHLAGSGKTNSQAPATFSVSLDTGAVVLDDFADGNNAWKLVNLFGAGYWWVLNQDVSKAIVSDSGHYHFHFSLSDSAVPSWSNFGLSLDSSQPHPSLGMLRNLRMTMRGEGRWTVLLTASDASGKENIWQASLALDSSWGTRRLAPSAFAMPSSAAKLGGSDRLVKLVFQVEGRGWADLRDVALEGVSLGDWGN